MNKVSIFNSSSQEIGSLFLSNGEIVSSDKLMEKPDYFFSSNIPLSRDEETLVKNFLIN